MELGPTLYWRKGPVENQSIEEGNKRIGRDKGEKREREEMREAQSQQRTPKLVNLYFHSQGKYTAKCL